MDRNKKTEAFEQDEPDWLQSCIQRWCQPDNDLDIVQTIGNTHREKEAR